MSAPVAEQGTSPLQNEVETWKDDVSAQDMEVYRGVAELERQEAIAEMTGKAVMHEVNGHYVTADEHDDMIAEDQDRPGGYDNGARA